MKRLSTRLGGVCLAGLLWAGSACGGDWAAWRGPYQNGVSLETGVTTSTKDILWRIPSGGHSTPVISNGRLYAINLSGKGVTEQEQVYALDAATGKELWHYRFNCFHTDVPNSRVGWASVAVDPETGNVYANGVQGLVLCLDRDGKLVWSVSTTELFGRVTGYGGRTYTPIIDEDRVIVAFNNSGLGSHAPGAHRFLALDKKTGEIVWWSTPGGRPEDPTYSNPVVAVIGGQRLIVAGNADGNLYAVKARTGEKVWGFTASKRGLNASPVVDGYRVFITHSEENLDSTLMGRVICIDGRGHGDVTKTHELWRVDGIDAGFASPLLHSGRLYVMSNSGVLHCFDAASGKRFWQFVAGRIGKGSPVWADGKIYLTTANGTFVILEDKGDSCEKIDAMDFNTGGEGGVEIFSSPALSDGRIAFCTTTEMICFGKRDAQPQPVAAESLPEEAAAETEPAALQIRPAEVVLRTGESVKFQVLAYDRHGRQIGPVAAACSFPLKLGTLDTQGHFVAGRHGGIGEVRAELPAKAAGTVLIDTKGGSGAAPAESAKLVGTARVRVVPALPISEDFESFKDGDTIGWWVGVSKLKYTIETRDGSKVLKKLHDDKGPILNRSLAYITPPIPAGYTVEADVMGVQEGRRRGDVGVTNARYVLELFGAGKKLRVMSWIPGPRFEKKIAFPWAPGTWYRMKLKVEVVDNQGEIYAKVWPRNETEPKDWTIRATDPQPNVEGAAGIYANSTMAPLYLDNVKVYR
jgi:outer membrane protein assembly factor BamB